MALTMARIEMVCPFSKKTCVECGLYRGRHYDLCLSTNDWSFLGNTEEMEGRILMRSSMDKKWEVPPVIPRGSNWLILDDFLERGDE